MDESPSTAGFRAQKMEHVKGLRPGAKRPLSLAWISDELLERTQRVWSEAYGRDVDELEAVEILMNVKQMAEVLKKARREMNAQ
jgi:hypothetical protein